MTNDPTGSNPTNPEFRFNPFALKFNFSVGFPVPLDP